MKTARLLTLLVIFTTLTVLPAMAGVDWKPFDVGNISCAVWNTAVVGFPQDPTANPSGWWPAGTNDSYIYEGDIWIGAKKGGKIGVSESDGRSSEIWPTDDVPEVISQKPGVTTKGTPTSQYIYFKCNDMNTTVNDNPLGLAIEINGFQWSYAPLYDFFILEHKVKNIGDSDLEDVFMAFRYDIDVSSNETGTANYSGDDFIALDETPDGLNPDAHPSRNMSYGYSNASAPGYIGIRVLDAYTGDNPKAKDKKIPFTAHKRITIDTDPTTDEERYALISVPGVDPLPANYDDQRYVQSYGPIKKLAKGEEFNVVLVVAIGKGLDGLRASADWAQKLYDDEYIAPAPPPSPRLTAYPGEGKVTLVWDPIKGGMNVEEYVDPTDEEKIFEGYRIYRREVSYDSATGEPTEGWTRIAEFDKPGATGNFFTVSHVGKKSDATISIVGDEPFFADFFKSAVYIIKFTSSTTFEVVNTTLWEVLEYNGTLEDGGGYAIIKDMETGEPYPDGAYRSGEAIYFGGLYVSITDGPGGPPVAGDIFKIVSTPSMAIGSDTGIQHHFTDEGLINGIRYAYAVTSYDTGNPKTGLISMESSKIETTVYVYPRSHPAGYKTPESSVEHIVKDPSKTPLSDGEVTAEPIEPNRVTGHTYKVIFNDKSPAEWTLTDTTTGAAVLENQPQSDSFIIVDGLLLVVNGPAPNMTGKEMTGGSGAGAIDFQQAYMGGRNANHHDYELRFGEGKGIRCSGGDFIALEVGFELWDIGYGTLNDISDDIRVWPLFYDIDSDDTFSGPDYIVFTSLDYGVDFFDDPDHSLDEYWGYDPADPMSRHDWTYRMAFAAMPGPGDVWRFISTKPNTSNDVFTIVTKAEVIPVEGDKKILDNIKVVPNPYFVTNRSVTQEGTDRIFFTHLPAKCTIRIYTLAGEFVRQIEHDGFGSPFPDDVFVQGNTGGTESYDLLTYNQQALASGIYIYHVDAGEIGQKIGKFAIIRGR
ncbi:hypothetical protein FJZ31_34750 [Candidatus Poribacteria bacterium]|nr:hypothetical protein [Candidatus Poribacteria bacterium]